MHTLLPRYGTTLLKYSLRSSEFPISRSLLAVQARLFSASQITKADPKETKITSNYKQPQVPKSKYTSQLPVYPLLGIFFLGSFLFYQLANSRQGKGKGRHLPDLPRREAQPTQFDRKNLRES